MRVPNLYAPIVMEEDFWSQNVMFYGQVGNTEHFKNRLVIYIVISVGHCHLKLINKATTAELEHITEEISF